MDVGRLEMSKWTPDTESREEIEVEDGDHVDIAERDVGRSLSCTCWGFIRIPLVAGCEYVD